MSSSDSPGKKEDDDCSTGSANSTVSPFIRKIIPANQWTEYIPQAASNLFGGNNDAENKTNKSDANGDHDLDIGKMLFDAVPFNGDTDRTNSYTQTSSILPNFVDMNIDIPLKRFGSNISNISPIGNVSSRVPFDEDDDSDDDLDRILGSMKAGLRMEQQQLKGKGSNSNMNRKNNGELLNTTLPTLLDANSLDPEEDVTALGDCVFQPSTNRSSQLITSTDKSDSSPFPNMNSVSIPQKTTRELSWPMEPAIEVTQQSFKRNDSEEGKQFFGWKSKTTWLIAICFVLILITAVMIGLIVPSSGIFRKNIVASASSQAQDFATSPNATSSPGFPTMKPSFLRPALGPEGISASPPATNYPTSLPTQEPFSTWSEKLNKDENIRGEEDRLSSRLPQVRLDMGPMVGHTTHDSVTLWAYYLKPAIYLFEENYKLEILLYDSDGWLRTIDEPEPDGRKNNAVFATITNLEAHKVYRFEMRIMGQVVGSGSFQTAPSPSNDKENGSSFEYLLASCMDKSEYPHQNVWSAIPDINSDGNRDYPDFAILAGDTIYLQEGIDVNSFWGVSFERYWYRSSEQRTEPHFADFISNTPIYAIWNNHDYGADVSDKDQLGKEESLRAWNSLWPNPSSPGNGQVGIPSGIYYSFYWGDVHYIITDDHWNRDPLTENRWGFQQTQWIRSELISSTGTFKVIVLGSDIMDRDWSSDLENIGAIVTENAIDGVLFHAGDIHRNEYKKRDNDSFPYPVYQITSSGIAKVWRKPFAKIAVDTGVDDPFITVRFFGATSMEDDTTWANDPELICDSLEEGNRDGEHSCSQTIRLSDLRVKLELE